MIMIYDDACEYDVMMMHTYGYYCDMDTHNEM